MSNVILENMTWDDLPHPWTKAKRKELFQNTRQSKDESFQKGFIRRHLGVDLTKFPEGKRSLRLNKRTIEAVPMRVIKTREDFVDWTEDFDGYCQVNNKELFWNLKNITCAGGSQNRSIRPIIDMTECFAKWIKKNGDTNKYFICITDGQYLSGFVRPRPGNTLSQFEYVVDQVDPSLKKYFFFGQLKDLREWWSANV